MMQLNRQHIRWRVLPVISLFVLLALSFTTVIWASPEDKVLRFSVPPKGWPPFIIPGGRESTGIMLDVVREITKATGYALEISVLPQKRVLAKMERGEIDAWSKSRAWVKDPSLFLWTDPVVEVDDHILVRRGVLGELSTPQAFVGKRVGAIRAFHYPRFAAYFSKGTIIRVDVHDSQQMMKMVQRNRTDAAIINKYVAQWIIRTDQSLADEDFAFSPEPVSSAGYSLMFTRQHDWSLFISTFNRELAGMKNDGRLNSILARYQ